MDEAARAVYLSALADVRKASSRRARGLVVTHAARILAVNEGTVWRNLRALGWSSGRVQRKDAGQSSVSAEDLAVAAAIMAKGRNKRGQPNIPASEAHRIAQEHELGAGSISCGHLLRRLSQEGLSPRHLRAPEASISRVSQHPNHVWQFDISVAIQWYFRDDDGKKLGMYVDAGARFYEGKRQNLASLRQVLHRFALVDHYSGARFVQYYYTPGERWEEVVDFFWRAMGTKELGDSFPFRGIPRRMVMDQGPANKTAYVKNLLEELGVQVVEYHAPRNAKASGAVEKTHDAWQRSFEGRLALQPARDLAELNRHAAAFCAVAGGERVHARHGRPPLALWATIRPEQLVECPDRDTFFQLAASSPKTGVLDNRHWLRATSRAWQLRGENLYAGQRISYRLTPFVSAGIRCWDEHGRELSADVVTLNEAGFPTSGARFHVWDDEAHQGATAPATPAQRLSTAVAEGTVEAAPGLDVFGDFERRARRQAYLATKGSTWQPRATELCTEPLLGRLEALEEIVRRLGRPLGQDAPWWRQTVGEGVTRSGLDEAWTEFCRREAAEGGV